MRRAEQNTVVEISSTTSTEINPASTVINPAGVHASRFDCMDKFALESLLAKIEARLAQPEVSFHRDERALWTTMATLLRALLKEERLKEKRVRWPPRLSNLKDQW